MCETSADQWDVVFIPDGSCAKPTSARHHSSSLCNTVIAKGKFSLQEFDRKDALLPYFVSEETDALVNVN